MLATRNCWFSSFRHSLIPATIYERNDEAQTEIPCQLGDI